MAKNRQRDRTKPHEEREEAPVGRDLTAAERQIADLEAATGARLDGTWRRVFLFMLGGKAAVEEVDAADKAAAAAGSTEE